jgi:hypothetical protein
LRTPINGKPLHPGVNILRAIDFLGLIDFRISRKRLFDKAANLFFVSGVPFDGLDDQTMSGSSGLLGERAKART